MAWATKPATMPSDSQVRSRRRGCRRNEPTTARPTAIDTKVVNTRFKNSTMAFTSDALRGVR